MVKKVRQRLSLTPLAVRVVGLYGIIGVFIGAGFLYQTFVPNTPPPSRTQLVIERVQPELPNAKPTIVGSPDRLIVERLDLNLPIEKGYYSQATDEWTLSDNEAFFATMTDMPNDDRGSTFIYGHNRPTAFEPLKNIKSGDIVTITTSNGHAFSYVYAGDTLVQPTVTDVLAEDPPTPQLVLMTCEGLWSEVRRIMYFTLTDVRNV